MAVRAIHADEAESPQATTRLAFMGTIWLAAALCIALCMGLAAVLHPVGLVRTLRIQFTYSVSQFVAVYGSWTDLQRQRFNQHFWFDYPFLICYGLLGYLLATHFSSAEIGRPMPSWSVLAMPFAAVMDAMEDMSHQGLINALPKGRAQNWQALLAGACATTKWMLIGLFFLLLAAR